MKKAIFTLITGLMFTLSLSSFASDKPNEIILLSNASQAVSSYIESVTGGTTALNEAMYAEDFEYRNSADTQNRSYNKKQYLKFLKHNEGLLFDCTTSSEILDQAGNTSVAKVTMQFKNFTRVDYITLHADGDSWKVNKVVTTYPSTF